MAIVSRATGEIFGMTEEWRIQQMLFLLFAQRTKMDSFVLTVWIPTNLSVPSEVDSDFYQNCRPVQQGTQAIRGGMLQKQGTRCAKHYQRF